MPLDSTSVLSHLQYSGHLFVVACKTSKSPLGVYSSRDLAIKAAYRSDWCTDGFEIACFAPDEPCTSANPDFES